MRLAWKSALLLPMLLLPVVVTQAQTCSNGIAGYEASDVCCPRSCGSCGGPGCSKRGDGCCTSKVKASGESCSKTGSAPCNIDSDSADSGSQRCSNGIEGIDGNGVVCCPLKCGQCGGKGCTTAGRAYGLGSDECCGGGVKSSGKMCSKTGSAPCIIDDEELEDQRCSNGIKGIDGNGVVCCPLECGQCGGKGCTTAGRAYGLGSDECCGGGVKNSGKMCSDTGSAPCIIDDGSSTTRTSTPEYSSGQYGKTYSNGEATYYGETTGGQCSFGSDVPEMYDGMIPVALNNDQWEGSMMCGACIEGTADGSYPKDDGGGHSPIPRTFKAFVTDRCPECVEGDLDFAMGGDGRWFIDWKFVECPGEKLSFVSPSANPHYWKLQPRGTKTPVETLTIDGQEAHRSDNDNFFVRTNSGDQWYGAQTVEIITVAGEKETTEVQFY